MLTCPTMAVITAMFMEHIIPSNYSKSNFLKNHLISLSPANSAKTPTKNFVFKCHRDGNNVHSVNAIDFHHYGTFCTAGSDGTYCWWDKEARCVCMWYGVCGCLIDNVDCYFSYDSKCNAVKFCFFSDVIVVHQRYILDSHCNYGTPAAIHPTPPTSYPPQLSLS